MVYSLRISLYHCEQSPFIRQLASCTSFISSLHPPIFKFQSLSFSHSFSFSSHTKTMFTISSSSQFTISNSSLQFPSLLISPSLSPQFPIFNPKPFLFPHSFSISLKKPITTTSLFCKSNEALESEEESEWLEKLPEKTKPLYSHSLPCIEAWLKKLGFNQSKDDRALWVVHKSDWHAHLSLDVTDLYVRFVLLSLFLCSFLWLILVLSWCLCLCL